MKLENIRLYIGYYIIFIQMFSSIKILKILLLLFILFEIILNLNTIIYYKVNKMRKTDILILIFMIIVICTNININILKLLYNIFILIYLKNIFFIKLKINEKIKIKKFYFFILKINIILVFFQYFFKMYNITYIFPWQSNDLIRPMGLFSEPSHLAFYILGILFFSNVTIKYLCLIFPILILIKSFVGYIVMLLLLFDFIKTKYKLKTIYVLSLITLFIFFIKFDYFLTRYERIKKEKNISLVVRVFKGPRVYKKLLFKEQILGIGIDNNLKNTLYTEKTNFENTKGYLESYNYYSGIFKELIEFGMIGFFILQILYFKLFNRNLYVFFIFEILRLGISLNIRSTSFYFILLLYNCKILYVKDKKYEIKTFKKLYL